MPRSYIPENKFVLHPPFPFIFLAIKIVRKRCCFRQALSTDGVNGPITPLLINEWEKRFQCQPVSWVSPIPCGAVRVVQPLGSAQPSAVPGIYPKSCGSGILRPRAHPEAARRSHAGEPGRGKMLTPNSWVVLEVLSCYPRPCRLKPVVFSSVGAGLHRSAVPEPLPALLLRGDWSCQVLIWSLPWRRSRPARRLTFTRECSAKALGRKI